MLHPPARLPALLVRNRAGGLLRLRVSASRLMGPGVSRFPYWMLMLCLYVVDFSSQVLSAWFFSLIVREKIL